MDQADFPWQQLGTLLVDEDLLSREELERALSEQRRTGQKLGQIIVGQGSMTGTTLAKALARQHGVELRNRFDELDDDEPGPAGTATATLGRVGGWRPLGKVLLDGGLVSEDELDEALAEKRADHARRPGSRRPPALRGREGRLPRRAARAERPLRRPELPRRRRLRVRVHRPRGA